MKNRYFRIIFILAYAALLVAGASFVFWSYDRGIKDIMDEAMKRAQTAAVSLNGEALQKLHGVPEEAGTTAYVSIKQRLTELPATGENIRFAYLYVLRGNRLFFLADSEPPDSPDYSPPGQEYSEADPIYYYPFVDGKPLITQPVTDRWGTWVSVLVPVVEPGTGKVSAVFAMDYPADKWERQALRGAAQSCAIVVLSFLLLTAVYVIVSRARKELQSLKRISAYFENLPVIYAISNYADRKYVEVGRAFSETLGYGKEELLGRTSADIGFFLRPEKVQEMIAELRAKGVVRDYELQIRTKSGRVLDGLFTGQVIEQNGQRYFLIVMIDQTERKRALDKLKNTISGTNAGTWEWNVLTGEAVYNERWADIIGYTLKELQPVSIKTWETFAHPDDAASSKDALRRHWEGKTEYYGHESRMRHKDGSWVWVYDSGKVTERDKEGRPLMMYGTRIDISELKKASEVADRLAAIVRDSSDAILGKDLDGVITEWNAEAGKLYGYKAEEIIGRSVRTIVPPDKLEELDSIMKKVRAGEKVSRIRTVRLRKDGTPVDVSLSVAPIRDAAGVVVGISTSAHDITQEMIIDRAKNEFVSLVAHQLKTPVGALSWNLDMLLDGDYGKLARKQAEVVTDMHGLVVRMNDLVNSFLNLSRIELGVFVIEPVPTDLAALCREVLAEMEPRRAKKGQVIIEDFDEDLPAVPADQTLLRIVFQNYISNAVKYSPDGGKITVALKADGKEVVIGVANGGPGVPEADRPRIFEKMFRASNANGMDPDGNGLGLYLVRKIMENAGGRVWFTSKEDEETVFYASLPLSGMLRKEGTKRLS